MSLQTDGTQAQKLPHSYWPEIDGLRSIAVLSVLVFHFDRDILRGGFVGVDIFFVISGFLIATVLLNDIDEGRFSVGRFYQRRIARIAPAFFFVVAAALMSGAVVYSAQDFAALGAAGLAASLSLLNFKLIFQGGYFQASPDAQPLLHYWSLAVEEQFYLLFPLYLYVVIRFAWRPLAITLLISALSYAACVALTKTNPIYAFYLLPTRAWELLAGASLALFRRGGGTLTPGVGSVAAWGGLALLAVSFVAIAEGADFPGWIDVLPVLGTVMIIASVGNAAGGLFRTLMAHPLPVFVGKLSYSLYLWHWPIFSMVDYRFFSTNSAYRTTLKILLCIAATLLTYYCVERPMRGYLNANRRRSLVFGAFAVTVVAFCAVGFEIRSRFYLSADVEKIAAGGIEINRGGRGSVVLIGDSQATMYGYELASLARAHDFRLNILGSAGANQLPSEANTRWPDVERFLTRHPPDVIILAEAWSGKLANDARQLRVAMASIDTTRSQVILITEPPILPKGATREAMRAGARPPFYEPLADRDDRLRANATIVGLANDRVAIVDYSEMLMSAEGAIRFLSDNGGVNYYDHSHLSDAGTGLVRPAIERAILKALGPR